MKTARIIGAFVLTLSLAGCFGTEPPSHPQFGKQTWIALGPIAGTKDAAINGAIRAHYFEGGKYVFALQLNIEQAPKGKTYMAWLEKPGSTDRVYAGELMSPTGDVRHVLSYNSDTDLREYRTVYVTLQNSAPSPVPAEPIARGTLEDVKQ